MNTQFESRDIGQVAVPAPIMAQYRSSEYRARLRQAEGCLARCRARLGLLQHELYVAGITPERADFETIANLTDETTSLLQAAGGSAKAAASAGDCEPVPARLLLPAAAGPLVAQGGAA